MAHDDRDVVIRLLVHTQSLQTELLLALLVLFSRTVQRS